MANDIRFNKTGDILNHYLASMQGMTSEIDPNIGDNMSLNEHIGVSHELQTITLESVDLITFETTLDVPLLSVIVEARCFVVDDLFIPLDEITIYHTGKNLIDVADCESAISYRNKIASWLTPINKGNYTLSFNYDGANANFEMVVYYANSDTTETMTIETGLNTLSFTANDDITAIEFYTDEIGTFTNFQIEVGDIATIFEEYNADNVIIDLGGNVYGCSINTSENVLIITHEIIKLDGTQNAALYNWRHTDNSSGALYPYDIALNDWVSASVYPTDILFCNAVRVATYYDVYNDINSPCISTYYNNTFSFALRINDPTLTTKELFDDYLSNNPIEVVFKLKDPIIIPITPEVIKQFKGVNNMYVEQGTTSVTYRRYKPD